MVEILQNDPKSSMISTETISVKIEIVDTVTNGDIKKESISQNGADFEEAISASKYGKFNILLMLCSLPALMSAVYVTSALSYVVTSAECDLNMTSMEMGTLNIITYCGMMSSAMLWGFLSDTLGRKKIMVWGFLSLALCEFISSFSQDYWMLVLFKFLAGFIFNGPYAVLISYISELHPSNVRAKVLIYIGIFFAIANINLPLIAWSIIPNDWNITLFGANYVLHSWHIFLAVFTIPPLLSGITLGMLPESPKFLMSRGRNDEALKVFQTIYSMNTGKPPDTYPIKQLKMELGESKQAPQGLAALRQGASQLRPLCSRVHLPKLLLICFLNMITMLGANTLRLWFPQMATIIEDYGTKNNKTAPLCHIINEYIADKSFVPMNNNGLYGDCVILQTGTSTYVNSLIIGGGTLITYSVGGMLINKIGKRKLTALSLIISGFCSLALYWSTSLTEIVTLFTIFVSASSLSGTALTSVIVDLFPTSIRAMAVAIFFMMGRTGTVIGGITFTYLLELGCLSPFIFISSIMFSACIICFTLPRTSQKKLE